MSSRRAIKSELTPEQIMELKESHVILSENEIEIIFVPNLVDTIMMDSLLSAIDPDSDKKEDDNQ